MKVRLGLVHTFWHVCGMRRLGTFIKQVYPSAYGDTIFSFKNSQKNNDIDDNHSYNDDNSTSMKHASNNNGLVVLTIDDGLVRLDRNRGGSDGADHDDSSSCSMVKDVCNLLATYDAHATFFVCTKYTQRPDAQILLNAGHEIGNHLEEDRSGYYFRLSKDEFRDLLLKGNQYLQDECGVGQPPKWFRAPQGIMNKSIKEVLKEEGMKHVLGDVYCDDWAFAEYGDNNSMKAVAPLMLKQVQPGSIAIFHMPQHGFREGCLDALKEFLDGLQQRGMRCVSLTEMTELCSTTATRNNS